MQQPSINHYLISILPRLQLWEYICLESNRNEYLDSELLFPTQTLQMSSMFWEAAAFNQPLLSFNTAKVTDVRAYNRLVWQQ